MTKPLVISTPSGVRRLGAADMPVRIGSDPAADIRVPGPVGGPMAGLVGSLDDRPFLQATGGGPLEVNGEPVSATRWLADGDVISSGPLRVACHLDDGALRLEVTYADTEYATLPPGAPPAGAPDAIAPARPRAPAAAGPAATLRRAWWLYAGLALLALAAWHLFTARVVRVDVVPPQASLRMEGSLLAVNLGGSFLLRPGRYSLRLSAPGYEPATEALVVDDAPRQSLRYELRKLPGRLRITTNADGPLRVSVDGRPVAPAADGSYAAPAGRRTVQVAAERYLPFSTQLDVEGRDVEQALAATLTPNWADVTVVSEPPGATIRLPGAELGVTPATVRVPTGSTEIAVGKDGYKTWRRALTVAAGQALALPPVRLQEVDGLLGVVTTPPGASVTVDGRFRGTTPLEVEIRSGETHAVIVARPGYETVNRSVSVQRRGAAELRLELAPRVGVVRVEADPTDAEVWVNGERRGAAGVDMTLPAVAQRLEVRKPGFVAWTAEVTPRPGLPQVLRATLLTPQQAVVAATPRTVTTKQGAVLRLVEPGAFEMGAPRREQGRRPNESQRPVRITRRFYLGVREVTNREYREFRGNHTSGAEKYQQLAGSEHPVVMLAWEDAAAFCNWLSDRDGLPPAYVPKEGRLVLADPPATGYRLPTEAEWEWASRYNGGGGARRYPWGEQMPPAPGSGNFADQSAKGVIANVLAAYDDGFPVTAPVGSFAASPLGIHDLGGNAAEWVSDRYTVYPAGGAEAVDPLGPAAGQYHVIRGSSWRHAGIGELRLASRDFGDQGRLDVGFRLARWAD